MRHSLNSAVISGESETATFDEFSMNFQQTAH